MNVLLTGATGFIGRSLFEQLRVDANVFPVVRSRDDDVTKQFDDSAGVVVWDLANETAPMDQLPKAIDSIVHMAQSRCYQGFPEHGLDVANVNVTATAKLLDYGARCGAKTFCYASSGSVYEPYIGDLSEESALTPTSVNGCTKAAGEMLVRGYAKIMKSCALRLFTPYGPGQVNRLFPKLIDRIELGETIDLAGGLGPLIRPLYISDAVRVMQQAVLEEWEGAINVAGIETLHLRDIVRRLGDELSQVPIIRDTSDDIMNLAPPTHVLEKRMDVSDFITHTDGIRLMLEARR